MVSKTQSRIRKKAAAASVSVTENLERLSKAHERPTGSKVRIRHDMKKKRKYAVGMASPYDVYAAFEDSQKPRQFKCPTCGFVGCAEDGCVACMVRTGASATALTKVDAPPSAASALSVPVSAPDTSTTVSSDQKPRVTNRKTKTKPGAK